MTAEQIRDACGEWLDQHRLNCTQGAECPEPLNLLAYVAHCLGVRSEARTASRFIADLVEYERVCPNCPHLKN